MSRFQYSLIAILLLAGCATHSPAPIVDRSQPIAMLPSAAIVSANAKQITEPASGIYVVKKGDTLYRIALDHGLAYRDLASWNNLGDVNDIKVDQSLRLTAPEVPAGVEVHPLRDTPPVATSSAVVVSPPGLRSYPKALKLPYGTQSADSIGKQYDGNKNNINNIYVNKSTATEASRPVSGISSAPEVKTPEKSGNKESAPVKMTDENVVDWIQPTSGRLLKPYTDEAKGVDFAGKMGQPVLAAESGKVVYAGSGLRGYGKMVIIKHNSAYLSAYAHNSKLLVKEGDAVKRGEKIAEMGNSDTDQVKLHFEIRKFGKPVDPTKFITAEKS
ncbi:MAG: hypothetical protein H6R07_777 [Proteobacteria bacterium]|nr:hypothetical protein [Pseudomonadota bacterium]